MDRQEAQFAVFSTLAYADGEVSQAECLLLFHALCRHTSLDKARQLFPRLSEEDQETRRAKFDLALDWFQDRPVEERAVAMLQAFDFAAIGGINATEEAILDRMGDRLEIPRPDRDAMRQAVEPSWCPETIHTTASVRVAQIGPDPNRDFFLSGEIHLSLVLVAESLHVRSHLLNLQVRLNDAPLPAGTLIELDPACLLTLPPHQFLWPDLLSLVEAASQPWIRLTTMAVAPGPPQVTWWKRGTLLAVEASSDGVTLGGTRLQPGVRTLLTAGLPLRIGDTTVRPPPDLTTPTFDGANSVSATAPIQEHDELEARTHVPRCFDASAKLEALSVHDIQFRCGTNTLVDNVSFDVHRGELVAIIGPSGCGKTTLIELIGTRKRPTGGQALVFNGKSWSPVSAASSRIGFVPQDEVLLPNLSVRESVDQACRIRIPLLSQAERKQRVDKALLQVGLTSRADMLVGSPERRWLSGGQRRRVGVAHELVADPDLILLDEPLSGLSSYDARMLMDLFRGLARRGRMLLVVVHQPSSEMFNLFDKVLVLDQGGKAVFFGAPGEAIEHFAGHGLNARQSFQDQILALPNHPDLILDTIEQRLSSGQDAGQDQATRVYPPEYWETLFRVRPQAQLDEKTLAPVSGSCLAPRTPLRTLFKARTRQFATLLRRHATIRFRNRGALALSLFAAPFLGLLLALIVRNSPGESYHLSENPLFPVYLFMVPVVVFFLGLSGSCTEFLTERRLFQHESIVGVPSIFYLLSKSLVLFAWAAVDVALFLVVSTQVLEVPGPYLWMFLLTYATACVGVMSGLLVSAFAPNARVAHALVPVILIPQLVFSGVVPYDEMNPSLYVLQEESRLDAPILGQIMASRWCFEGLVVDHASGNRPRRIQTDLELSRRGRSVEELDRIHQEIAIANRTRERVENRDVRKMFDKGTASFRSRNEPTRRPFEDDPAVEEQAQAVPEVNVLYSGKRFVGHRLFECPMAALLILWIQVLLALLVTWFGLRRLRLG